MSRGDAFSGVAPDVSGGVRVYQYWRRRVPVTAMGGGAR
jgi:hypothetical protein